MKNIKMIRWRPYPKKKPKHDGHYLISIVYSGVNEVITDYYENGIFCGDDILDNFVIAWAKKPKPYKG